MQVLSDDDKRRVYDQFGEAGLKGGMGGMGGESGCRRWCWHRGNPGTVLEASGPAPVLPRSPTSRHPCTPGFGGMGGMGAEGFSNPFDIFETFFGGGMVRACGQGQPGRASQALEHMVAAPAQTLSAWAARGCRYDGGAA